MTPLDSPSLAAALLLADGRLPTGGHAHSWGLEAAVAAGTVADLDDVAAWIRGAIATTWAIDAAATAMACRIAATATAQDWCRLDAELSARLVTPAARNVARQLGRQLARTGRTAWPATDLAVVAAGHPDGPLAPLVLGALCAAASLSAREAATVALHGAVQGGAGAAVRLLGLDPFGAAGLAARLGPTITEAAARAAACGPDPRDLPVAGAPLTDILFASHAVATTRMFAS